MQQFPPYVNDELLVKHLLGETSPEENAAVEKWITESPSNRAYYDHFKLIWDKSKQFAATSTVDEDAAWQRFRARVDKEQGFDFSALRIAATLLIAVCTIALAYMGYRQFRAGDKVQLAAANETKTATLPDGSEIVLNKNSSISYSSGFTGKSRNVKLKGEGFFKVQPDKTKPFVIETSDLTVTVVGTSFNIREREGSTEVLVESGIVKVSHKNEEIELRPGEKATLASPAAPLKKEQVTDRLHDYYRTKTFTCNNTPLWKLVEVLNEAYQAKIVIKDPAIRDLRLNTTFNEEPLDRILYIVSQTLDLTISRENGTIILQ
ncbi:FecR domain-containing protein [Flavihumibacter solisilvae]|uniref:FecR protein domain-containing protein n=1 Tax=Flavihumibacter solisilvae TaxID=1349421 RepID=A0A0C1L1F1_9BACT|nr:FecR domain-containing protein [Flavihumibacter solisilvae]KIC93456.1 hypothetical protein OI18_16945 [Flavihumibacter solisilvae]